jgi:hypothetical protein
MKRVVFCCLLFPVYLLVCGQNKYFISKPEPSFSNNILTIKYNITGCGRNEFVDITLLLVNTRGDTLRPGYITGDIGRMISCGLGKTIEWDLEKDNIKMDEDMAVIIKGVKSVPVTTSTNSHASADLSRRNVIMSSVFIPGLGQMKASGRPIHLIFSGVVYGSVGASVYSMLKSRDYKNRYNDASGTIRDDMFAKWQKNYNNSKALIFVATGAWVANIVWSAIIPIKPIPDKNLKVSLTTTGFENLSVSAKWTF